MFQLTDFSLELLHRKFYFAPFGLFRLDFSLLYSVSTYNIMLVALFYSSKRHDAADFIKVRSVHLILIGR